MSDPILRSKLAPTINTFVEQKRASGYPYNTSFKILGYLDLNYSPLCVEYG